MPQFPFAPRVLRFLAMSGFVWRLRRAECAKFFTTRVPHPPLHLPAPPAPPTQDESAKQDAAKSTNAQQPSENSELVSQDTPGHF